MSYSTTNLHYFINFLPHNKVLMIMTPSPSFYVFIVFSSGLASVSSIKPEIYFIYLVTFYNQSLVSLFISRLLFSPGRQVIVGVYFLGSVNVHGIVQLSVSERCEYFSLSLKLLRFLHVYSSISLMDPYGYSVARLVDISDFGDTVCARNSVFQY